MSDFLGSSSARRVAHVLLCCLFSLGSSGAVGSLQPQADEAHADSSVRQIDAPKLYENDDHEGAKPPRLVLEMADPKSLSVHEQSGYSAALLEGDQDEFSSSEAPGRSENLEIGSPEAFDTQASATFQDCPSCPVMVRIPAGSFTQGSPTSEPQSLASERPQRVVNVSAFAMAETAVTFAQWDACVADGGCAASPDDAGWGRGDRPVINVDWNDAQQYISWLSNETGKQYRLASESEWEYAARASTSGRFNTGNCITTNQANFRGNFPAQGCSSGIFRQSTVPVGTFSANAFGVFEAHGNVFEWTRDCWNAGYSGGPVNGSAWTSGDCSQAVVRGGSWAATGDWIRSAARTSVPRSTRAIDLGFRVATSTLPAGVPGRPSSISYPSTSSSGSFTVTWASSSTATVYQLERSDDAGSSWTRIYDGTATSRSQSLGNGNYRFRVRACNSSGCSDWRTGSSMTVDIPPAIPSRPSSISYPSSSSTGSFSVSWAASSRATRYRLARSSDGGSSWTQIYEGSATSRAQTVGIGTYRYRVRACNASGCSDWRTGAPIVVDLPTTDEPSGSAPLPTEAGQSCPGFFVLRTHPGPNSVPGRFGVELLLRGEGSRMLQGGLNFGGRATPEVRGFAAFTIANPTGEQQVVNLEIEVGGAGNLILERRSGGQVLATPINRNIPSGRTQVEAIVPPGFYVVAYTPSVPGPVNYSIAALSSYVNRPGGGFQGGVVFGGYHDPSRESTGFAGFCIADPYEVEVKVLSQPSYGSSGARDMAFSVSAGSGGMVYLDSRAQQRVQFNQRPVLVEAVAESTTTASVSWLPATDHDASPEQISYRVHLGSSAGFTPSAATVVFTVSESSNVRLEGLNPGSRRYVKVEAFVGQRSLGWSNELSLFMPSVAPILNPDRTVWVLDETNINNLQVRSDRVIFDRIASNLQPRSNDLIVSAMNGGVLRGVVSVSSSGNRLTLHTDETQESLSELFAQADLRSAFHVPNLSEFSSIQSERLTIESIQSSGRSIHRATWPQSGLSLTQEKPLNGDFAVDLSPMGIGVGTELTTEQTDAGSQGEWTSQTMARNTVRAVWPSVVSVQPDNPYAFQVRADVVNQNYELVGFELERIDRPGGKPVLSYGLLAPEIGSTTRRLQFEARPALGNVDDAGRPYRAVFTVTSQQVRNCVFGCNTRTDSFEVPIHIGSVVTPERASFVDLSPGGALSLTGTFDLDLNPDVFLDGEVRNGRLQNALFSVGLKPATLTVSGRIDATASDVFAGKKPDIIKKTFVKIVPVGSVPVVITGVLSLDAEFTVDASASMLLEQTITMSYEIEKGVHYVRGQGFETFTPAPQQQKTFSVHGSATGKAGLDVRLVPRLEVSVYELATARAKLEPYVLTNTELQGHFSRSADGRFDDSGFRFTQFYAAVGMDLGLNFDATIWDWTLAGWPTRDPSVYWNYPLIPEYALVDLPRMSLSVNESARLSGRPNARRVSAQITNTSPLHPFVSDSAEWRISPSTNVNLHPDPNGDRRIVWVEPTGNPSDYVLRFHGHGRLGSWVQQYEQIQLPASLWQSTTYRLTVNSSGATSVPIQASPTAYAGTTNYQRTDIPSGTTIQLTAPSSRGNASFSSWSGCSSVGGSGNRTCTVSMNQNRTVTANYSTATTYQLTVNSSGASNVPIQASPTTYAGTTNYHKTGIPDGTRVELNAPPARGSANFESWSGCDSVGGAGNRLCTVNIRSNRTVTASYSAASPTTPSGFVRTESSYAYNADPQSACRSEFGSEFRVADWNDVRSYYESGSSMQQFFVDTGLTPSDRSAGVTRNGSQFFSSNRAYFISRHDGQLPANYLAHDQIGGHLISLGSWNSDRKVLCVRDGHAATYTLQVRSSGVSNVAVGAVPSTYSGTTNYQKTGIPSGTSIQLIAPSAASGRNFSSWSGCSSVSGRTCTVEITQDLAVTANYVSTSQTVDLGGDTWDYQETDSHPLCSGLVAQGTYEFTATSVRACGSVFFQSSSGGRMTSCETVDIGCDTFSNPWGKTQITEAEFLSLLVSDPEVSEVSINSFTGNRIDADWVEEEFGRPRIVWTR